MTREARNRIRSKLKGNQNAKGCRRSLETRERIRKTLKAAWANGYTGWLEYQTVKLEDLIKILREAGEL